MEQLTELKDGSPFLQLIQDDIRILVQEMIAEVGSQVIYSWVGGLVLIGHRGARPPIVIASLSKFGISNIAPFWLQRIFTRAGIDVIGGELLLIGSGPRALEGSRTLEVASEPLLGTNWSRVSLIGDFEDQCDLAPEYRSELKSPGEPIPELSEKFTTLKCGPGKFDEVQGGKRLKGDPSATPKFSIITVVRNGKDLVGQTIESVLAQTSQSFEYIVIDGQSNDGTVEIIKSYGHLIDFWRSAGDDGIYDAMNIGLRLAQGEFVIFLNAGDILISPDVLAKLESELPGVDAVYGITRYSNGRDMFPNVARPWYRFSGVGHPAAVISRETYKSVGLYYPMIKVNADAEMMFRIERSKRKFRIKEVDLDIVFYRSGGFSDRNELKARRDELVVRLIYGESVIRTVALYWAKVLRSVVGRLVLHLRSGELG
jgi:Glycosyl transferase family 2